MENRKFTPENISELKENEVFVFGSNKAGNHAGGAARLAVEKFGAVIGQAEGLQGQSYAIPTLDENMEKVDLNKITVSVMELYKFAKNNPEKTFYVTKIGCGIAGFSVIEMGDMFKKMLAPRNVILPKEFCVTKGYKVFNNDMTCRGFQYKEGDTFEMNGTPELCGQGFHFCENPLETRNYYGPTETVMHEVEAIGDTYSDGIKSVTNKIKIGARLDIAGICKAHFEFVRSRCTNENNAEAGKPASAGFKGSASAGNYGSASAGENGSASAGFKGSASAGFKGSASAGFKGSASAGNYGSASAGENGSASAGENGSASAGENGSASAGFKGSASAGENGSASAGENGSASAGENGSASAGENGSASAGSYGSASAGNYGSASAGNYGSASAGSYGSASAGENGLASAGFKGSASAGSYGSAISRGKSSTGNDGLSVARGSNIMVRGGIGAVLVIAEENEFDYNIREWKSAVVDGEKIKADTWYKLVNGEFVEVKEK